MSVVFELLKAILFGIVEGVTEWLPVSSTGHMILLDQIVRLDVSDAFYELFQVVIQLGAIAAVVLLFFKKLNPFAPSKSPEQKKETWTLWMKVVVAVIPSGILGLLLDDWMDEHLYNYVVVAIALIVYGVIFIYLEQDGHRIPHKIRTTAAIDYRTAVFIGLFQCLSLIPGTSRSGSTILGAMLLGVGRSAGAEFSFFLAIPTMLGASALKLVKFLLAGTAVTGVEIGVLAVGCITAFVVSLFVIRGLMDYVRRHSFTLFGLYRITLGVFVLFYYFCITVL